MRSSFIIGVGLAAWLSVLPFKAPAQTLGLPILFVHGFCDQAASWQTAEFAIMAQLKAGQPGSQYPDPSAYTLYYDGNAVRLFPPPGTLANPAGLSFVRPSSRFFAINFYAPGAFGGDSSGQPAIDAVTVANVSILNKADELAHVIKAITSATNTTGVVVVGHSQGGLVARAYLEGLASPTQFAGICTDTNSYKLCSAGTTPYGGDIAKLITLDTPHGGVLAANISNAFSAIPQSLNLGGAANSVLGSIVGCIAVETMNRRELAEGSTFISWLNQQAGKVRHGPTLASIDSYILVNPPYPIDSDGVVTRTEQSIVGSVQGAAQTPSFTYYDVNSAFSSEPPDCEVNLIAPVLPPLPFPQPLHLLTCLGQQARTQSLLANEIENAVNPSLPSFDPGGVVNAASYSTLLAPGSLVAAFGYFPVPASASASGIPWPIDLGGASLEFSGGVGVPLSFVSARQVNFVIPWELAGRTQATLRATVEGETGPQQSVALTDYAPSIFSNNGQGTGQGAILDRSGHLVGPDSPAVPGKTIIAIFCTGLGPVTHQPASGAPGLSSPLSETMTPPIVSIGGDSAQVLFSGLAPGLVGVYQVNALVPAGAPGGNAVPVTLSIGGKMSNTVTIAVATSASEALAVQSVTLSATSVAGGSSVTATVTLSGPAPAGGVQVNLASSNSNAQLPASVTAASGRSSATFTITTTAVISAQTATITASLGASAVTAVLTVSPSVSVVSVSITEYPVPTAFSNPQGIAAGPEGALWFTEYYGNNIGRITTAGVITEYPVPTPDSALNGIVAGPDGALWFTENYGNNIGRITTAGVITEYPVPTPDSALNGIVAGPDGALWFTETDSSKIGRITTAGVITEYAVPTPDSRPVEIAAGPDGALWFTEFGGNNIGRITTAGVIAEYPLPTPYSSPLGIAAGPDGALWFTEYSGNNIGRITPAGGVTEYPLSNPSSGPWVIVAGPDGSLWFTESDADQIGRVGLSIGFTPASQDLTRSVTSAAGGARSPGHER